MTEHRRIRRRVGWALLALGGLTLAYMIASHNSPLPIITPANLLAIPAGAGLLWGGLASTRAITWCLAVWLTVGIGVTVAMPLVQPWEVTSAMLRYRPGATAFTVLYQLLLMGFSVWAYRSLRAPAINEAMRARGGRGAIPWVAFGMGALIALGLAAIEYRLSHSEAALMARAQARLEHGPGRTYDVETMRVSDGGGEATLYAYSPRGTDEVEVVWGERVLWFGPCLIAPDDPACDAGWPGSGRR